MLRTQYANNKHFDGRWGYTPLEGAKLTP